jgi:hypothetical protein
MFSPAGPNSVFPLSLSLPTMNMRQTTGWCSCWRILVYVPITAGVVSMLG